eukprot:CAMPEP_0168601584 /NCGR_PEP_ID=MMETSP0420-20121227/13531_1 /TAXON_ID=498008 /ORGANISM="Pessonella sp." /LENGTH=573 /DNA_ID=CAMNT_0008640023 /DNA_START=59 /DNA_END=1780 /DNA_ORIENTATION=+
MNKIQNMNSSKNNNSIKKEAKLIQAQTCLHCGKDQAKSLCITCKAAGVESWYCSTQCQDNDWFKHRSVCGSESRDFSKLHCDSGLLMLDEQFFNSMNNANNVNNKKRLRVSTDRLNNNNNNNNNNKSKEPAAPAAPLTVQWDALFRINNRAPTSRPFLASSQFKFAANTSNGGARGDDKRRRMTMSNDLLTMDALKFSNDNVLFQSGGQACDYSVQNDEKREQFDDGSSSSISSHHYDDDEDEEMRVISESYAPFQPPRPPPLPQWSSIRRASNGFKLTDAVANNENNDKHNNNNGGDVRNDDVEYKQKQQQQQQQRSNDNSLSAHFNNVNNLYAQYRPYGPSPSPTPVDQSEDETTEDIEDSESSSSMYTPTTRRRSVTTRHRRAKKHSRKSKKSFVAAAVARAVSPPPLVVMATPQPRRNVRESHAKKMKRQQYSQLSEDDLQQLKAMGVEHIETFAKEFKIIVNQVVYLHTRRQHIINWLAQSKLFPLLSWDLNHRDEFGQPMLSLNVPRNKIHKALTILLKCQPTEWLFKRVHNATTAEGHWRFKRGQYALLMQHAAKAVGAANVPIQA